MGARALIPAIRDVINAYRIGLIPQDKYLEALQRVEKGLKLITTENKKVDNNDDKKESA